MPKYRFTVYEIHGQETVVEADTPELALVKLNAGEGETVGQPFFVRNSEEMEPEIYLED